jgi:hypothetical protein
VRRSESFGVRPRLSAGLLVFRFSSCLGGSICSLISSESSAVRGFGFVGDYRRPSASIGGEK